MTDQRSGEFRFNPDPIREFINQGWDRVVVLFSSAVIARSDGAYRDKRDGTATVIDLEKLYKLFYEMVGDQQVFTMRDLARLSGLDMEYLGLILRAGMLPDYRELVPAPPNSAALLVRDGPLRFYRGTAFAMCIDGCINRAGQPNAHARQRIIDFFRKFDHNVIRLGLEDHIEV